MPDSFLEPEYQAEFDAWKTAPGPETMTPLLTKIQPAIDRGISAHIGQPDSIIRSDARRLAVGAIKSYDPTKAKLTTHVVNHLAGLRRIGRKQIAGLSVPERLQMDAGYVTRARNELEDRLGREPTLDEIADHTGLSRTRIMTASKTPRVVTEGQMAARSEMTEQAELAPAVERTTPDDTWAWVVYDDQDDTNKKILEWTLGLGGQPVLSNQAIAHKLRLTPGAVSQRKAKLQAILDQRYLLGF